jgi:hypothetical protein
MRVNAVAPFWTASHHSYTEFGVDRKPDKQSLHELMYGGSADL